MSAITQLVVEVETEEYGQAHIGHHNSFPVHVAMHYQLCILPQNHQHAQHQRNQRAEGEPFGTVIQVFQIEALGDIGTAEAVVADGDTQPRDEAG